MLYSNYLKKHSKGKAAPIEKGKQGDRFADIRARVIRSFEDPHTRIVRTPHRIGMFNYSFNIVRVRPGVYVLYRSEDILQDGATLQVILSHMFDAMGLK